MMNIFSRPLLKKADITKRQITNELIKFRFQNKSSTTSYSQLGSTFNQIPSTHNQQQQKQQSRSFKTKKIDDFRKLFSSVNLSKFSLSSASKGGLFGLKELNSFEGFYNLEERASTRINDLIKAADEYDLTNKKNNGRNLVQIFDEISNELCRVADLAEFVRTTHPNINYRQAANLTFTNISQIVETLNTNFKLYSKLKRSYELAVDGITNDMDECDKRVCKLFLIDFEQSGIHLDERARNKFVHLNHQLIDYLTKFQSETQTPSYVDLKSVEPKFTNLIAHSKDPILIDTMYANNSDELVREFFYKSYLKKNDLQEAYFRSILKKRKELANVCEFETFSHRANQTSILETPKNIIEFLESCSKSVRPKVEEDLDKLRHFKKNIIRSDKPLMQWDMPYLTNIVKRQTFDLNNTNYMNYFSLGSCMEGLNLIFNRLYDINLEVAEPEPKEVYWNQDIYKLAVKDSKKGLLGYIYCDFYQRPDKYSNVDCHFTIQCSKLLEDNTYQVPIVVLHLNFQPPTSDRPTLLSFEMMENLFHEFGHAMHSMFAKTRYQHVSGTRCSTDLAEMPSQLMEYYCKDPRILKLFAKHYITLEPLSDSIIEKLCESRKMFASCDLQSQILNSLLDQAYHTVDFEKENTTPVQLVEAYTNKYASLPFVKNTHSYLRFTHLVGYGAKYYAYLVAKAMAAKLWSECFEKDPLSSAAGDNYRKKVLEFGGEKPAQELISSFSGLKFDNKLLAQSLTQTFSK